MTTDVGQFDRILLVGDTHGNPRWTPFVIDQAQKLGADLIVQLGDFGYWPRDRRGSRFLDTVEQALRDSGLPMWFIDGNHEDHTMLRSGDTPPGLVPVSDHLTYVARGTRWTWGDTEWLAVGGASSVDRHLRTTGFDWFEDEFMTPEQLAAVEKAGHADVVVAHDAPAGVEFIPAWHAKTELPAGQGWPADALADSAAHSQRMRHLLDVVQPRAWFHGHHHVGYHEILTTDFGLTDVYGLDMDSAQLSKSTLLVDGAGVPISVDEVAPSAG